MRTRIDDPDVQLLAGIADSLKDEYIDPDKDAWLGSPFEWIKARPSRQVGKIGEQLVSDFLAARGYNVVRATNSDADRIIEGVPTEIKFSTLWKAGGFKFQQIRDQRYDMLICIGLMPFDVRCWAIPKHVLYEHVIGHTPQHTGQAGSDTFWLSFEASRVPAWLDSYGGTLREALESIYRVTGRRAS